MLNNLKNQSEQFRDYFTIDSSGKLVCSTSETYFPAISTDTITATTQVISNVVISNYSVNGEVSATGDVNAFISSGSPISLKNVSDLLTITTNSRLNSVEAVNSTQNSRLDAIDILNATQNSRLNSVESVNSTQNSRLNNLENLTTGTSNLVIDVSDIKNKVQNIVDVDSTKTTFKERLNMRDVDGNIRVVLDANGTSNANTVLYTTPGQGVESGYLNVQSINVKDSLGNNKINFNGNTSQTFLVSGDGRFTDSLIVEDNLNVQGNASLNTLTIFNSINPFTVKNATDTANLLAVNPATNEILIGDATQQSSIRFPYSDATITYNSINFPSATFSNANILSNLNTSNISANGSLNVSGTTNLKNLNINGNLNVYGGSFTSQSVINQYTSMSIIMNPAGSVPALSISQTGGTGPIMEISDADANIKFSINQDCDVNLNDKINMDSATGNITSLGTLNCSAINVANNFISNNTSSQFVNDTYIGDNGIEVLTAESPSIPALPSNYSGTVYQIHNETELTNAIASAVDFDILELRGDITLTATATINKNLKLTSHNNKRFISFNGLNATTINWTGQGGYVDNVEIRSLGTGSNEVGLYLNNQSGNFVVNNCLLNVDEFGISCNVNSFIIRDSTFNYSRLPANESMRYIQLLKTGANSVNYIHNNVFNGIASGDASIQCISTANAGLNAFPSSTFSITNNTSSGIVQRLFMMDSTNMTSNNCTWYLMNNSLTCSSGFYIWYHPSALISQVAFYCSGNTETLGGSATGSKGLIGLDSIGLITSVNYSCKFFGKNNNIPVLRADYSDLSQNSSRVIAYNNTKLTPTQTFDTVYYDNVNIDGLLNVNSNATFTKNVSITGTVSASNLSGTNTGDQNTFTQINVSGQTSLTANTTTTQFNLIAGTGMSILTNDITKSITLNSTGIQNAYSTITANNIGFSAIGEDNFTFDAGSGISFDTSGDKTCIISNNRNQWNNIAISGQTTLNPTSTATTLNLVAGTGMSILTNNSTKSITFNASGGGSFNPTINNVALYDMLSYNDNIWTNLIPLRNVPSFTISGNSASLASVNHVFNISSSSYDWQLSINSNFNSPIIDDNTASPTRDFQAFVTGGVVYYVRIRVVSNWLSKKTQWFSTSFTAVGLPLNWTNRTPQNTLTVTGWLSDGSWNSITQNPNIFVGVDVINNISSGSSRPPLSPNPWYSNGNTVVNGSLTENNMTLMVNNTNVNETSYISIANSGLGYGCIIFDLGSTFFLSSGCIIRAVWNIPGGWGNIVYANGLCVEYYDTITGWVEVGQYPTISQVSEMQNFYTVSFGGAYQSRFWRVRNKTSLYTGISGFRLLN